LVEFVSSLVAIVFLPLTIRISSGADELDATELVTHRPDRDVEPDAGYRRDRRHTAACLVHAVSSNFYSAAGYRIGGLPCQVVYGEKEALYMSAVIGDGLKPRKVR
jgi:hypothetical protein